MLFHVLSLDLVLMKLFELSSLGLLIPSIIEHGK